MLNFYNNLSPATKLLIQSFLAVLGSVLAGVVTAVYQSYVLSQQLNLAILWNVAIVTFALLFAKAMHDWIPAHTQQLIQAAQDEKQALYDALQKSQSVTSAVIATQGSLVQTNSPQPQIQPVDIQALSQQLALNLMNLAKAPQWVPAPTSAPAAPAQDAYEDPLRVSMKLPAYVPPVDNTTMVTSQSQPQTAQVSFQIPVRPATMP